MARGNFGERLKRERELREVSLEEITSATRIGPRFLEALENEEWEKLPGGVFNRGFVRSVARYLGLDEESFLAEYDLAHGPVVPPSPQNQANHFSSRPKWIPFVAFLLLLAFAGALAAGGYYGWRYYVVHRAPKQSLFPLQRIPTCRIILLPCPRRPYQSVESTLRVIPSPRPPSICMYPSHKQPICALLQMARLPWMKSLPRDLLGISRARSSLKSRPPMPVPCCWS